MSGVYLDERGELQGALITSGHRMMLVCISVAKMALEIEKRPAERLRLLEFLEQSEDFYIKPEMIARIEAMPDDGWQIVHEAWALSPHKDEAKSWQEMRAPWDILESQRVFGFLLKLNPSMLDAIRWRAIDYPEQCRARGEAAVAAYRAQVRPAAVIPAPPPPHRYDIPDRFMKPVV